MSGLDARVRLSGLTLVDAGFNRWSARSQLEVYREPQDGNYHSVQILRAGAQIAPLSHTDTLLEVTNLLPR